MGQGQLRIVRQDIAIQEHVQVEGARAPVSLAGAAQVVLESLASMEQFQGRQADAQLCHEVEEARLVRLTHRGGVIQGREGRDLDPRQFREALQGGPQIPLPELT